MENKSETLSKLYGLRASLSLISQVNDKIQNEEDIISDYKKDYNDFKEKTDISISKEEDEIEYQKEKIKEYKKDLKTSKKGIIILCVLWLIGSIFLIPLGVFVCVYSAKAFYLAWFTDVKLSVGYGLFGAWLGGLGAILGVAIVVGGIGSIVVCIQYFFAEIVPPLKDKKKAMERIDNSTLKIEESKKAIKKYEQAKNVSLAKMGESCTINKQNIREFLQQYKDLEGLTEDTFKNLLDKRHWKFVDLCIYYLETGTADTIKECLQLIENVRIVEAQTGAIVKTINNATKEIGQFIQQGFNLLSQEIRQGVNDISIQLENQSIKLDNLSSGVSNLSFKMSEVVNQQKLSNALKEKASVSSDKLVEDVNYMRVLAEQEMIKRRNGG